MTHRATQVAVETLASVEDPEVRATQVAVETLASVEDPEARVTQVAVETLVSRGSVVLWLEAWNVVDDDPDTLDPVAAEFSEVLRVTLDDAYRLATANLLIGHENAGEVTYTIEGANTENYSDAVELAIRTFTATGSFTPDAVAFSWGLPTAYRFYRLIGPGGQEGRIHDLQMYDFGAVPEHVHSIPHADTTGQTPDDHHDEDHASRHAADGDDPVSLELDDLADVDTTSTPPEDGQALVYDDGSGLWVPGDVASGGGGGGGGAYAETIGDTSTTSFPIVHDLGTTDVVVALWDLTGSDPVLATGDAASIEATDADTVTVTFAMAPATDSYRVVVVAGGSGGGGTVAGVTIIVEPHGIVWSTSVTAVHGSSATHVMPVRIPAPMYLRGMWFMVTANGTGTYQWGLFDYSANPAAATKLAGGSGTLNSGAGEKEIAASGGPILIPAGAYMLAYQSSATNNPTLRFTTFSTIPGAFRRFKSAAWSDTPDFTTGWGGVGNMPHVYLRGDLDDSGSQW